MMAFSFNRLNVVGKVSLFWNAKDTLIRGGLGEKVSISVHKARPDATS